MASLSGCYTALVTPLRKNYEVDYEGLRKLAEFQMKEGVDGILAVGTTGESPTLDWNEHNKVIEKVNEHIGSKGVTIAGTGSNSTQEAIEGTVHAQYIGVKHVLLVDPYYNGPSSMEIRKEYIEPVAKSFPEVQILPYVIPGRTGTQLLPQDLALLHRDNANVCTVKEATGDLENMKLTRKLCGKDFTILSGDDEKTFAMMTTSEIAASGVISVASNIAPGAVKRMTRLIMENRIDEAKKVYDALQPLFGIITVKTQEDTIYGQVLCRARNPLASKTLMNVLGMPSGPCRRPLGKMTRKGLEIAVSAGRETFESNPEILEPIEKFFDVDLNDRLYNEKYFEGLFYG